MAWITLTNLEDKLFSVNMERAKTITDVEHKGDKWTIILFSGATGEHLNVKESRMEIIRRIERQHT